MAFILTSWKETSMKSLLPLFLLCALVCVGCTQTPTVQSLTATLVPPEVLQATFTPLPGSDQITPTPTSAVEETAPTVAPTLEPTATPEVSPTSTPEVSPTPTEAVAEIPTTVPPAGQAEACIDKAAFYDDVTIPDGTSFKQGISFTKTWQIRNEGTCTWNRYKLVYAGGDQLDGPIANPMPVVAPGETANVSVDLKSPPQGGLFTGLWEFENSSGQRFGVNSHGKDFIWVKISVSWYTEDNPPGNMKNEPVSASPPVSSACQAQRSSNSEAQILTLINQARAENNLPALTLQTQLSSAAYNHSADMACNDYLDHTGSDGSNFTARIKATGYNASYTSENIYAGDPDFGGDPAGAFDWWMHSDIHRKNILSSKVTSIGIGAAYDASSTYKAYYTINFARP